ncbi:MAG: two-component regulator propeller domain-containing protein [Bacteroidota bacterium]
MSRWLPTLLLQGFFCLFIWEAAGQHTPLVFKHHTVGSGLAHSNATVIIQDRKGFIWIGTERGLSRYDGTHYKTYRNDPSDKNSLFDHFVINLAEGQKGEIWIGTREALTRFDPPTERFTNYLIEKNNPDALNGQIWDMHVDQNGDVWLAMATGGVSKFEVETQTFTHFREDVEEDAEPPVFTSLTEDPDGFIWAGLDEGGLDRIHPETGKKERFAPTDERSGVSPDAAIQALHTDEEGVMWVGTDEGLLRYEAELGQFIAVPLQTDTAVDLDIWTIAGGKGESLWLGTGEDGLLHVDKNAGTARVYQHQIDRAGTISSNQIRSVLEDRTGTVWTATNNAVSQADLARKPFRNYTYHPNVITSLSSNDVYGLAQDEAGGLWVATINGLNYLAPGSDSFMRYFHDDQDPRSIAGSEIWSVFVDHQDDVWLGPFGEGLDRRKKGTYNFLHYPDAGDDSTGFQATIAFIFYEDSQRRLWIGSERGLHRYYRDTDTFELFVPDVYAEESGVRAIYEDDQGILWIGSELSGLYAFDPNIGQFIHHYMPDPDDPAALTSTNVLLLFMDSQNVLWAGTDKGLHQVVRDADGQPTGEFRLYLEKDGLADNGVVGMLEDDAGYLWISTSAGLSRATRIAHRADPSRFRLSFKNYDTYDGLASNTFYIGPSLRGNDGFIYLGGDHGYTVFDPATIKDNTFAPEATITDVLRLNKSIKPGAADKDGRVLLDVAPPYAEALRLNHTDRVISISFSALHFGAPEKNQFKFRLQGFESEWTIAGDMRQATYTNLPAGTYTFEVMAANGDGIWNDEPATLQIQVAPPFWQTLWFRALVVFTGMFLIIGFYQSRTRSIRQRNLLLESRVATRTEELREKNLLLQHTNADLVSSNEALQTSNENLAAASQELRDALERNKEILGITAHDLKNPLGGVIGLADIILEDAEELAPESYKAESMANVKMLKDEVEGMLQNVRDLLDRYRDDYSESLKIEQLDLNESVHHVLRWNGKAAREKGIQIIFEGTAPVEAHVDRTAIQRVMDNLVSNAVKYTLPETAICIKLDKTTERIRFSVSDKGPGLTAQDKAKAFRKMQRLSAKPTGGEHSTGLGLYIVRKLVEMHGGRVGVDSEFGSGATFWFDVPAVDVPAVDVPAAVPAA